MMLLDRMSQESSLRDVSRAVYENIRPQIYPVIEEVVLDHKHLIKVEFLVAKMPPYSAAGRYYLRTAMMKTERSHLMN